MSVFRLKITHHTKTQEDLKVNGKRQLIDANTKLTDLEWSDEDFEISHHKISLTWRLQACLKQMENMEGLKK